MNSDCNKKRVRYAMPGAMVAMLMRGGGRLLNVRRVAACVRTLKYIEQCLALLFVARGRSGRGCTHTAFVHVAYRPATTTTTT